jgi:hypothetical protein
MIVVLSNGENQMYQNQLLYFNQSGYEYIANNTPAAIKDIATSSFEALIRKLLTRIIPERKDLCDCKDCLKEIISKTLDYLPETSSKDCFKNDINQLAAKAVERAINQEKFIPSKYCYKVSPLTCINTDHLEWAS